MTPLLFSVSMQSTEGSGFTGWLGQPIVAYLLLVLGAWAIFFELAAPGLTVPALAGGLGIGLGLWGAVLQPTNWAGVILLLIAFLCFYADIIVKSLGLLTAVGVIAFILGSFAIFPDNTPSGDVPIWLTYVLAFILAAFFYWTGRFVRDVRGMKSTTGREGLLGTVGIARGEIAPYGVVFAAGELWQATAVDGDAINDGTAVVIAQVDGLRVTVRPASAEEAAGAGVAVMKPGATI